MNLDDLDDLNDNELERTFMTMARTGISQLHTANRLAARR